ncbi:MAG TPA: cephalosporin hydroxylase family protein [Candidatus Eremiobacteraceae bacterium]|nr:cephalosporin hydroxylase family protein [Candidatus Eremiobacteraceae bacterium]
MSDREPYDSDLARRMKADAAVTDAARSFFDVTAPYRYSYNFTWLGRPIIQYPQDIIALQEIVWRVRPRTIVETGIAHGGSTVLFASLLELLGDDGRVVAVDVDIRPHNRKAIEEHPLAKRIDLIEGSSVDAAVIEQVRPRVQPGAVMVVLDSNHTRSHVLAELEAYSPLVTRGSYLVVMDTVVEHMEEDAFPDRPWGRGDNPLVAVREFLARTDRFAVDDEMENKLLITVAPSGYLRCVKD